MSSSGFPVRHSTRNDRRHDKNDVRLTKVTVAIYEPPLHFEN